ncbi:NUDIX hydrolase [Bacillus salitolerans]|uniref:NUDIX hydrolase n=1 Tax=Bacillus salitolerans TaxID=1437434 RepID=A0ABW4LSN3_9BACI
MEINTFGKKEEGKQYITRPGAYCVIFNRHKDKIAIIETNNGHYFLPGGGIENNETHKECLKREALEEMGMEIKIGPFIGCARRYFYSTNEEKYYLSEGHFYFCEMVKKIDRPTEEDHSLVWMELNEVIKNLVHEHQSWAVSEALKTLV